MERVRPKWQKQYQRLLELRNRLVKRKEDLAKAATEGRLAGFATDVYPQEPPGPHPLYALPNVIALPHIASYTPATAARMSQAALERKKKAER